MRKTFDALQPYAPVIVRWGVSLVLLWFGGQQILHTANWTSFVPDIAVSLSLVSVETMVRMNGMSEIVFGALLLLGLFIRPVSGLLALHLFGIAITLGYNSIAVRDLGLALSTVSICLYGPDLWSIDRRLAK